MRAQCFFLCLQLGWESVSRCGERRRCLSFRRRCHRVSLARKKRLPPPTNDPNIILTILPIKHSRSSIRILSNTQVNQWAKSSGIVEIKREYIYKKIPLV